ncbi:hypothetical protein DFJ58DRAFT_908610 [Suillus subalutaceus]|uniref:uncharacterized protein n=1 Tax=Suillus subalutaceus TaxID=48586 RepID=UPI001B87C113|nr:uncharacterized protein DFJ58DRAFT_908610 [Suillus subalutaceus]KAG1835394.1 hypothetical protein DFJ58DRAFT_908610 [Suillus subalutaceus]
MMEGTAIHNDSTTVLGDVTFQTAPMPTLDPDLYRLSSEEAAFFKAQIGIDDDEDLKRHILEVQAKAYKIVPYPCIHEFYFLRYVSYRSMASESTITRSTVLSINISSYPVYEHILKLGRERSDAVLLDLGCCFGVDARKAAADGFPAKNIIASDINNEFLELSHELFRTTPTSYAACLLPGDVFDPAFLSIAARPNDVSSALAIDLSSLKSLNPLHGRISAINVARFFHLFTEDKQLHLARALAGLLSAQPGSVICGFHIGSPEKGMAATVLGPEHRLFAHSPKSWTSLWDGEVFEKGSVKVETELVKLVTRGVERFMMGWSVVRL